MIAFLDIRLILIGITVFALAALAQALTGFGSAMVSVPLLAIAVAPIDAVAASTLVGFVLTTGAWHQERAHVDTSRFRLLAATGLLGMPAGFVLLTVLSERTLTHVIAGTVLVLVMLFASGLRPPVAKPVQIGAGLASGALLTSTGMNGPPLVITLHDMEPRKFRATLQAVFSVQDALAVLGFLLLGLISHTATVLAFASLAGLPLGWIVGNRIFSRVSPQWFRRLVLGALAATAVGAIISAR